MNCDEWIMDQNNIYTVNYLKKFYKYVTSEEWWMISNEF